ncbi:FAD-dependent oxidoreductase [Luteimonas deserti]|uniref:FAD-dependent oxidoreductase n=1 Tax=Luteimonas deserti TaxID=2752306 RepID=A0A7Z0TYX6_9GAMM|nr:FAD-dependent oxidoreductase [Luteimonas deserti]NYZ61643.1 FAD-dependent oxidoreductase [Luteimonas deserti]
MSRRGPRDVVIAGGGVVGAACALALAGRGFDVVLVEPRAPAPWTPASPDLRVYALAHDNARLFGTIGVWAGVEATRAHAYRRMEVWDAGGGSALRFDADALAKRELGWIVEHGLLVDRLWSRLQAAGVDVRCPGALEAVDEGDARISVRLEDGTRIDTTLLVAADGADSAARRLAGIDTRARDYGQSGVVGYIRSERSHEDTAWQRFLPGGPLALLPCADGLSSIVWSVPTAEAERLLSLDEAAFADALTRASGGRLGALAPISVRAAFPLRRQLAATQRAGRVLVLGDAAHVVHPLAGQGVNLGLRDVASLTAVLGDALDRGARWDAPQALARWARARRSENTIAAHAFELINDVYSNDSVLPVLLRSHLLGIAGRVPPLNRLLWQRAAGG